MDRARTWIQVTVGLLILLEVLVTFVGISGWFRTAGFLAVLVAFLVVLPLAFIGDNPNFADPGSTPNSAPEESAEDENDEQGAFVHEETDFGVGLRYGGFEVSMMYAGYDLGLVEEDNRSSVRETPPEPARRTRLRTSSSIPRCPYGSALLWCSSWCSPSSGCSRPLDAHTMRHSTSPSDAPETRACAKGTGGVTHQ